MRGRRILAFIICMVMVCACWPGVALAAAVKITINTKETLVSTVDKAKLYEFNGVVQIPLYFETNDSGVTIAKIIPKNDSYQIIQSVSYDSDNLDIDGPSTPTHSYSKLVMVEATVSKEAAAKEHAVSLWVYFDDSGTGQEVAFKVHKTTAPPATEDTSGDSSSGDPAPETTPDPLNDVPILLMLSPIDAAGAPVIAPSGNAGENVRLRLAVLNRGGYFSSIASQIIITPEISASLDSFPFVVEAVDYSRGINSMKPGDIQEVSYNMRLSSDVKSGVKEVKFNCVYYNQHKSEYETAKFSVFVTVIKGKEDDDEGIKDGDGELITTQPKIIIESSMLAPDEPQEGDEEGRLYAGEPFTLTMRLRNTSSEEAVKNIQVTLSNEGNVIIPANNGSNSLYIARIEPGESVEREVRLQASPDAEPKSQNLSVKFSYESSKTLKGYEETQDIAVPILQRVRVRVNDPIIYGDGMMEQPISMSLSVLNLSKSTLYYCSVEVEGEGIRMEEPFYYGNVGGGGSMQADFNIIPSMGGDLTGTVVVIFEDAYNKQTRIEKPFNLYVMDFGADEGMGMMPGMDGFPGMEGTMEGENTQIIPSWLLYVLGGCVILALTGLLVFLRRKRRRKELTEGL